ncbi:DUF937 domain-containing protein [Peptoniphilus asaccharolyticus]|nr:DUF937 domain-containing protein [Peptoniphilus asaccharolyticus]MBL7575717.1 DUF937 domain-containing protein [Peptoniphilus asaccharolyticus]
MDYKDMFVELLGAKNIASKQGLSSKDFAKGVGALLPELLDRLNKKTEEPQDVDRLNEILKRHEDDDFSRSQSYIENLENSEKENMIDAILGGKRKEIEQETSQKTGLDDETIKKILKIAAPIILLYLSKNKKQKKLNKEDLRKETSEMNKKAKEVGIYGSFVKLLDKDGDGKVLDDLLGL